MSETEEAAYEKGHEAGNRATWLYLFRHSLISLGYDSSEAERTRWAIERESAIQVLRSLCGTFGDNDWDESLHLADIIEKHLRKHIEELRR